MEFRAECFQSPPRARHSGALMLLLAHVATFLGSLLTPANQGGSTIILSSPSLWSPEVGFLSVGAGPGGAATPHGPLAMGQQAA